MSVSETYMKPSPMMYRNFLAMETEEFLRAHPVDGAVLMGGCDKTTPGLLMGAISMPPSHSARTSITLRSTSVPVRSCGLRRAIGSSPLLDRSAPQPSPTRGRGNMSDRSEL